MSRLCVCCAGALALLALPVRALAQAPPAGNPSLNARVDNAGDGSHGQWSSVSGGQLNTATGDYSSISGGNNITAGADNSWAAGGFQWP